MPLSTITMTTPQLNDQLAQHAKRLRSRIDGLDSTDPMRLWFMMEVDQLVESGNAESSFDGANAALRAMKQVGQLLFEHCLLLQSQGNEFDEDDDSISFHSVQSKVPSNILQTAKEKRFSIEPSLLYSKNWDNDSFDPVSPTAKIVGFLRSRDPALQIARELAMDVQGQELLESLTDLDRETQELMGVLFQSRHHAINAAIADAKTSQVIELAAGISPRGLQWARSMPETLYVETDLPALMIHKAKLLRNHILASDQVNLGILHCCGLDVLDANEFSEILNSVDVNASFVIVSEGLLLYFDDEELNRFLDNLAAILKKFPKSVWVSDMVTKQSLKELIESHPGVASAVRKVFSMTGRSVIKANPFVSDACVEQALGSRGLKVNSQKLLHDVAATMMGGSFGQDGSRHAEVLGSRKIWSITNDC